MDTNLDGSSGYIHINDEEIVIHGPSGEIRVSLGDGNGAPPKVPASSPGAPGGNPPAPQPNNAAPAPGTAGGVSPQEFLEKYRPYFEAASKATGIPAELLAAMAWKESRGDANAPNGGLMQIDPTPKSEANPEGGAFVQQKDAHPDLITGDVTDPASNIMAAAFYLKEQLDRFGSWELALRAYNSGPEGTDPNNPNATPAKTGDPEYVKLVMEYWNIVSSGKGQLPP